MIYVSFVTKNTPYEQIVEDCLIPSLKRWDLRYYVDYVENKGSWAKNILYKPEFIYKMLTKYKEPIVSLDADATIEQFPELFGRIPNEYDIAVHYLDWKTWYGKGNIKELLGGTIYFDYNEKVLNMVNDWIMVQKNLGTYPQKVLSNLLEENKNIKIYTLPLSYCYIKTLPRGGEPLVKLNPVILHHQCSRKYKNKLL